MAGRGAVGKMAVIGMKQRGGRVKTSPLADTTATTIHAAISNVVAPGSVLCTDDHLSYKGLSQYDHKAVNHSAKQFVDCKVHTLDRIDAFLGKIPQSLLTYKELTA